MLYSFHPAETPVLFPLPDKYVVLDTKGTGLRSDDLLIRIDHMTVNHGVPVATRGALLGWPHYADRLSREWIERRLACPSNHQIRYEDLEQAGSDPCTVLRFYRDVITRNPAVLLVGHALFTVDLPLLWSQFATWLGDTSFDPLRLSIWDVGLMEKALAGALSIHCSETMGEFHQRVNSVRLTGIKWSLSYLMEGYEVDLSSTPAHFEVFTP